MNGMETLLGIGDEIACTLDASVAVGDLVAVSGDTGYPVRRLGSFEPNGGGANVSLNYGDVAQCVLSNGNIVVAYYNASNHLTFVVYDPTYTTIVVPATVVVAAYGYGIKLLSLSGGGFCVAYYANNNPAFAIFGNDGSVVRANTSLAAETAVAVDENAVVRVAQLSGGNLAFAWLAASPAYPRYAVTTSTGVSVKAATTVATSTTTGKVLIAAATTGNNFMIVYLPGALYGYTYDSSGTQTGSNQNLVSNNPTSANTFDLCATSDGGYAVAAAASSSQSISLWLFNTIAQLITYASTAVTSAIQYCSIGLDGTGRLIGVYDCGSSGYVQTIVSEKRSGTYLWPDGGLIQALPTSFMSNTSVTVTMGRMFVVAIPGGAILQTFMSLAVNSRYMAAMAFTRIGTAVDDLSISQPVIAPISANYNGGLIMYKMVYSKAVLGFGFGHNNLGPHIYTMPAMVIAGAATSLYTISRSGKHTTPSGAWPAGMALKSFPLLGGTTIDAAFVSTNSMILGG